MGLGSAASFRAVLIEVLIWQGLQDKEKGLGK